MDTKKLNIIFSSDDNYAPYLGAAIYSVISNNQDFEKITFYVIENDVLLENKRKIEHIIENSRNSEIIWISYNEYKEKLKLDLIWNISISSYARLFIAEMVPSTIERIIYMDCDMVVCDSLKDLWLTNLEGKIIGAVQDTVPVISKTAIGIDAAEKYFNSGMLLIDLNEWRKQDIGRKCIDFIQAHKGKVYHHDQGVLNSVLADFKYILPIKYNVITVHYIFDMRKIRKYYNEKAEFYPLEEINEAKKNPVILHFTPSFTSRPWVKGCKHPLKEKFWEALNLTPWKGLRIKRNTLKWYVRLIEWRYRSLPY